MWYALTGRQVQKMDDQEQMKVLADQLFLYMKPKIEKMMQSNVKFFRAQVVSNPGNNTLEVQQAFDNTTMTLPCATGISSAVAGDQVTVLILGSLSNAVVVSDGKMSTL